MNKKAIERILSEMKENEKVQFIGPNETATAQRIKNTWGVHTWGQSWSDQTTEYYSLETAVKIILSGGPKMAE